MGWGTVIKEVVLSKVSPCDIEQRLEEAKSMERYYKDELLALVSATPRDIDHGEYKEPWEEYAPTRVRELLGNLEEEMWIKGLCQRAIDFPEDTEEY